MAKLLLSVLLLFAVTVHLSVSQRRFQSRLFPGGEADNPSEEEPLERALSTLDDWAETEENLQKRALAETDKREGLGFLAETSQLEEGKREGGLGSLAEEKRGEVDASQLTTDHVKKALYRRLQDIAGEIKDDNLNARGANPSQGGRWLKQKEKDGQKSGGSLSDQLPSKGMGGAAGPSRRGRHSVKGRSLSAALPGGLNAQSASPGYAGYHMRAGYPASASYLRSGGYPGNGGYPGSASYPGSGGYFRSADYCGHG